jgi:hypothetical protein
VSFITFGFFIFRKNISSFFGNLKKNKKIVNIVIKLYSTFHTASLQRKLTLMKNVTQKITLRSSY